MLRLLEGGGMCSSCAVGWSDGECMMGRRYLSLEHLRMRLCAAGGWL